MAYCHPELLKDWAEDLNKEIDPIKLSPGSGVKVWWRCHKGHTWEASIHNRAKGTGCPFCSGKQVSKENCLATVKPNLAKEWHPTLNGKLKANEVTYGSNKKVWWLCSLNKEHTWEASISNRSKGRGCPDCAKLKRTSPQK